MLQTQAFACVAICPDFKTMLAGRHQSRKYDCAILQSLAWSQQITSKALSKGI